MAELSEVIVEKQTSFTTSYVDSINSLQKRLDDTKLNLETGVQPTIFRVPNTIRKVDRDAYEPVLVSLGPYNHGKPYLAKMEGLKLKYLKTFLMRNSERKLEDYMMAIKKQEPEARAAYDEAPDMKSEKFVEMMLLDCCFVLELLRIADLTNADASNDHELEDNKNDHEIWTISRALSDMLVSENQLPFFLLKSLCSLNDPSFDLCDIAVKLVIKLCQVVFHDIDTEHLLKIAKSQKDEFHHILHLLYVLLTIDIHKKIDHHLTVDHRTSPSKMMRRIFDCKNGSCIKSKSAIESCSSTVKKNENKFSGSWFKKVEPPYFETDRNITVPNVTKLKEAGLKFKRKKDPTSILDITYNNGIMRIPQLHVFSNTNYILRNLIAFEQFFNGKINHLANYVDFMDSLLDTADDVAELREHGIIINGMGSNDNIALLINRMCKKLHLGRDRSYLRPVCLDILDYANKRRNKWREKLNHDYFNNPWSFISFLAALMLLIFTIIQAIFSIVSYVKPPLPP